MNPLLAQTKAEILLAVRQKERLLATIFVPAALMAFLSFVPIESGPQSVLATVVATAVMAGAMVGPGIATSFERRYLILKRLGSTPLGRARLVAAKAGAVAVVLTLQLAVITGAGIALGESPQLAARLAAPMLLGAAAFTAMGMAFAGTFSAEANLAILNALFLMLMLLGGGVIPLDSLPGEVEAVARVLPSAPLTNMLAASFEGLAFSQFDLVVLLAWSVAATVLAVALFRWD